MSIKKKYILLFVLPALTLYVTFVIYPFIYSFILSFYRWPGAGARTFVGLQNFKDVLFGSFGSEFRNAFLHNIYYFILVTILELGLGFLLAIFLVSIVKGKRFFQMMVYLPNIISMILVGFIWSMMLNPQIGLVNQVLTHIGLGVLARPWLGDPNLALNTVIAVNVWRNLGFYVLVFTASLLDIPRELLEAAYIDGASNFKVITKILFPLTLPTFQTLSILLFIWTFNVFDIVYALEGAQAGPFRSTDVLGTLFYRTAFGGLGSSRADFGLGAAVAVLIFVVVMPLSLVYAYIVDRRSRNA
ncbi:carbohydrate ABC transporter permease [Mesoaciditoga lauensis]|uniref:carbohydrate ABC transporter permease n=1 Tax=Mesoaciditoga lauensis TaxID=1495039 RepID=UPI000559FB8C|nr:sugar ABC transporter permease [Mesoaciditoga lauensis]